MRVLILAIFLVGCGKDVHNHHAISVVNEVPPCNLANELDMFEDTYSEQYIAILKTQYKRDAGLYKEFKNSVCEMNPPFPGLDTEKAFITGYGEFDNLAACETFLARLRIDYGNKATTWRLATDTGTIEQHYVIEITKNVDKDAWVLCPLFDKLEKSRYNE